MTVPADITPDGVYLAVTAALLRDGTDAAVIPSYDAQAWSRAFARVVSGLTFQPARIPTDSRRA
ncbi:hypothetical protein FV242_05785 [Methylobacterium sp. WL64]|uniref:hypothetical protein n=1 Tax=Methylobacterium sp. WL64 TaxID=2603894 RepID=UPI0011CC61CF|nr:hypothetical protein [Methylobacterium sp. WL64]TXN04863.1 hypothetical protein FV242_05785 [Methylobacterium sp. WL64]